MVGKIGKTTLTKYYMIKLIDQDLTLIWKLLKFRMLQK